MLVLRNSLEFSFRVMNALDSDESLHRNRVGHD
jgi:hypothetical protein